jgi:F0F1-type ATP synthase membrane subunit b/b'
LNLILKLTLKPLDVLRKKQERVAKSFAEGNTSLKEATAKQKQLNDAKQELLSVEKQLNAEADRSNQKRDEAIKQEQRLVQQTKAGLRARQDRFDEISRDVSLAGDFQSNLGAAPYVAYLAPPVLVGSLRP